ncbi:MAG: alpha/beta hydrolase [Pirellulales bacterium]|nr:alpha/beta hydrolase [Planctomycetales bacterium]
MTRRLVCSVGLLLVVLSHVVALSSVAEAQQRGLNARAYPPTLDGATVEVYKSVGDTTLNIYEFFPPDNVLSTDDGASDRRPAIVFFFGGGWQNGSPQQFEQQCKYLASRGMVAMAADYRVLSRHGVRAKSCVADAKSAIRWVRANAARLGIDPERIVAAGGSAGGHIAACTGTIDGFDEAAEDAAISSRPDAMILFNPAVVLAAVGDEPPLRDPDSVRERTGVEPEALSPYHHVRAGQPPTLILHGKADETVPYQTVEWFTAAMNEAGNRCELAGYEDAGHGFFNYGRNENRYFRETLSRVDRFLASLGYVDGPATVEEFLQDN